MPCVLSYPPEGWHWERVDNTPIVGCKRTCVATSRAVLSERQEITVCTENRIKAAMAQQWQIFKTNFLDIMTTHLILLALPLVSRRHGSGAHLRAMLLAPVAAAAFAWSWLRGKGLKPSDPMDLSSQAGPTWAMLLITSGVHLGVGVRANAENGGLSWACLSISEQDAMPRVWVPCMVYAVNKRFHFGCYRWKHLIIICQHVHRIRSVSLIFRKFGFASLKIMYCMGTYPLGHTMPCPNNNCSE